MPDTMRIKLKLEDAPAKGWYRKKDVRATVDLQNLYGNPASGHKVKGNYTLVPASFSFKEFEGYHFRDPLRVEGAGLASYQKRSPRSKPMPTAGLRWRLTLMNIPKELIV